MLRRGSDEAKRLWAAAYNGVPVVGDRRYDVVDDVSNIRETVVGGAKFDQPESSQGMEIETDGDGDEMRWRWLTLVVEKMGEADGGCGLGGNGVDRVWIYLFE
ncbi:hypothetical protein E3N88_13010 [Mikania micrantha]|uniref:Uncharacterized protein n=1 Tax=Mikania micrantha TaxID=192012 RepID=A0A5N6P771_9ASTR|nr:hypothetical protein E3N88_13010 [Mikania micrantha]